MARSITITYYCLLFLLLCLAAFVTQVQTAKKLQEQNGPWYKGWQNNQEQSDTVEGSGDVADGSDTIPWRPPPPATDQLAKLPNERQGPLETDDIDLVEGGSGDGRDDKTLVEGSGGGGDLATGFHSSSPPTSSTPPPPLRPATTTTESRTPLTQTTIRPSTTTTTTTTRRPTTTMEQSDDIDLDEEGSGRVPEEGDARGGVMDPHEFAPKPQPPIYPTPTTSFYWEMVTEPKTTTTSGDFVISERSTAAPRTPPPRRQETTSRSDDRGSIYEEPTDHLTTLRLLFKPGILAAVIGGAVVGLLAAILLVMFIVYRMRKKDEGSYALDEPKAPPSYPYAYQKAPAKEFYA